MMIVLKNKNAEGSIIFLLHNVQACNYQCHANKSIKTDRLVQCKGSNNKPKYRAKE